MTETTRAVSNTIWARYGKRVFDVIFAGALLIALSPLFLLTVVLVKLTSAGPGFFSQDRAGKDGRIFRVLKFRTMSAARTPDPKELVPLDHPDITALGRVLRRLKIDEMPQLLHVLSGDMSLIGPRPTLPDQVEAYDDFRRQRLLVRPGVTGLAQVNGNTSVPWDQRILYDIAYVRRCGLLMDLGILLRTVLVLFAGEQRMTRPFESTTYAQYVTPPPGYLEA
ncbi:MAG: sugar transferase [Phycisphaerales bacterium]|nr:MAG: sugar transferase [Phycisphaerales bacterium]